MLVLEMLGNLGSGLFKLNYVARGKYPPNMNQFCDWLSEIKVISVHDMTRSFRKMISIVYYLLLS